MSPLLFKNSAEKEKTIFQVIQAVISRKYNVFVSDSSPENPTADLRKCDTTWRLVVLALVIRATALLREGQKEMTIKSIVIILIIVVQYQAIFGCTVTGVVSKWLIQ